MGAVIPNIYKVTTMVVLSAFSPATISSSIENRPFFSSTTLYTPTNTTTMARISAISGNWWPILTPQHAESFTNTIADTVMAQLRHLLDSPGWCHTTHNTTHHGKSPWWWLLWCWFSPQRANMNPALPQPDSYLSWLAILGGECYCWSNIHSVLLVPFQWLIWYTFFWPIR